MIAILKARTPVSIAASAAFFLSCGSEDAPITCLTSGSVAFTMRLQACIRHGGANLTNLIDGRLNVFGERIGSAPCEDVVGLQDGDLALGAAAGDRNLLIERQLRRAGARGENGRGDACRKQHDATLDGGTSRD
ncbi:hypothetical protein [Ralstonia sp. 22111]|uniref:hypothetical protein n=1 Tax=Ralstonia sp. 22111 TaxID=3453878 RepID=UPI003F8527B3